MNLKTNAQIYDVATYEAASKRALCIAVTTEQFDAVMKTYEETCQVKELSLCRGDKPS
jgi:hypothetical protein